jgi:ligand-binding sensor domain-containing protein/serine phosphatase RsbU (regulator of sigma subunit)
MPFHKRIIRQHCLMILFFAVSAFSGNAQKVFFDRYGVEQGLGSSKVYMVIQDRNDYVWMGTESGVARFDGSVIENFGNTEGLPPGGVYSLYEDTTGRIWFGHINGGLSYYYKNKFFKARIDTVTISGDISSIRMAGGYLWITTSASGAFRAELPKPGETVIKGKHYAGKEGLSDQVFNSYVDKQGNLFFITDVSLKKYNPETDSCETYSPPGLTRFFNVITMFNDSKGNYWYGLHNGGLYKQAGGSGEMKTFDVNNGLSRMMVTSITEDYRGNIWVGTWGGGISVFNGETITVYNKSNGLEAANIRFLFEDREKNMLIADYFLGLSIYKGNHFVTYDGEQFLPDNKVWAISKDIKGRYWFGTNGGVSVYDPAGKQKLKVFNEATNNIGNNIRFIKPDLKGNLWVGTYGSGIYRYDLNAEKFYFDTELNGILHFDRTITALETDKAGRIWIGTNVGLARWDPDKKEGYVFSQGDSLAGNMITALYTDSQGKLWIGSEMKAGLTRHIPGSKEFKIIPIIEGAVPKTISETSDGTLWVGTVSGLIAVRNDSVVRTVSEADGLLSDNIKFLQPDGNYLYVGTNLGLNRLNLTDGSVSSFTRNNGFTGIESQYNAVFSESGNKIWFGTANGAIRLDTDLLPPVQAKPVTHISRMEVNYETRDMKKGLKLGYKEKSVIFYYYSVSLTDPRSVKYKVMLKGAELDWRPVTDQTEAIYSALSPGHYTFMVMASNSDGYWSEKAEEYSFTIKPPFYLTPWFIISMAVIAVVSVISYIKIRERNLLMEKKILEEKVVERTAEVVQKSLIIEEKNRDITASIRYAERIQRAMLPKLETFTETFVLFMPKDIVSGDFYWMYDTGDTLLIAAVDCTGHGVPGAFMSIIGHNSLNKIVREYGITRPAAILDLLNSEVIKSIMQSAEKGINDGMDLALVAFNREKFTLEFAGAYNPMYHVRDGEVTIYKGDRFPIGMATLEQKKSFTNLSVDIKPGDMIYMCSDGYADQFGSADVKKFKSNNIKRLLSEIYSLPIDEQRGKLEKEILEWKGDLEQVDDILFVGTRITR